MKTVDSVCTYCGVGCDISAMVEGNSIKKIYAKKEGTVSKGKLCLKGRNGWDYLYSANRLGKVKIKKSFIQRNELQFPVQIKEELKKYEYQKDGYLYPDLELAYKIAAWKFQKITDLNGSDSFAAVGGARSNCESAYLFQKFTRSVMNSPHVDNCARVCHGPSLKGMRAVIGEGAATNSFDDIEKTKFLMVIGSNTSEAHPIVINRIIKATGNGAKLVVFDVRDISLSSFAEYNCVIPYESNLLVLNMMSSVILKEELFDKEFIEKRTYGFDQYRADILSDNFADPDFFQKIKGYEYLSEMIKEAARDYARSRSMILWGLGVTQHVDGSQAVAALCNLAILTGNVGKEGTGLMPLRGQNNVQGACDVGCLPYYAPDYQKPWREGKKTPDMINSMLEGEIKALFNMGEDVAHVHSNQNKIHEALSKLEFAVVSDIFENQMTEYADIVFGVKSAYEKTGVYINAERRLHLSQPLINSSLPDDWEVITGIGKYLKDDFTYKSSLEVWDELRDTAKNRFGGASYEKLEDNRLQGLQWPVKEDETKVLYKERFSKKDGLAHFRYKRYFLRNMVEEIYENRRNGFYLTTGRVLAHYNNATQTKECAKLISKHDEDIVLASVDDDVFFGDLKRAVLVSKYGKSAPLKFKLTKKIKRGTLFVSFHHAESKINYLFGDECDELSKTPRFKSIKVYIEPFDE